MVVPLISISPNTIQRKWRTYMHVTTKAALTHPMKRIGCFWSLCRMAEKLAS